MSDSKVWHDLYELFRAACGKFGDALRALWIGPDSRPNEEPLESRASWDPYGWEVDPAQGFSAWNSVGEHWQITSRGTRLEGTDAAARYEDERKSFLRLAERAAVELGHRGGPTATFFWLDQLKTASPNFRDDVRHLRLDDSLAEVRSLGGGIDRLFEASADHCYRLQTECIARQRVAQRDAAVAEVVQPETSLALLGSEKDARSSAPPPFPIRGLWLKVQLQKRAWNTSDLHRNGGPDRKTGNKILRGERVREDTLEKVATALSLKGPRVDIGDIPKL